MHTHTVMHTCAHACHVEGGVKVNPNTEIENEENLKNLHKNLILVHGLQY
jgi:hypothetical protein